MAGPEERRDHDALLRAVHDTHAPALTRYVARLTDDPAVAEDIVQESLLRLWRNTRVLEADDVDARRWLFTVARNLAVDLARSGQRRHEIPTDVLPDRATADEIDASLTRWLIQDALQSLSPDHRRVIVGAHHLGMTVAQLAEQEEVAPGTIKSRLHYGLRALRLALQERGISNDTRS